MSHDKSQDQEVLALVQRLQELRPDLVVLPRMLSEEMHFKAFCVYTETKMDEDETLRKYIAEHGGAPGVVSNAMQEAWTAAIEQFNAEGGVEALLNTDGDAC